MVEHADVGKRGTLWIGAGLLALFTTRLPAASGATIEPIEQPAQADDRAFIERAFAMRLLALDSCLYRCGRARKERCYTPKHTNTNQLMVTTNNKKSYIPGQ